MLPRLLDLIYPPECELCGIGLLNGKSLCLSCDHSLARISAPFCRRCGETYDGAIFEDFSCRNCAEMTTHFDFAKAALGGSADAFRLVYGLKYQRRFYLRNELGRFLNEAWLSDDRFSAFGNDCLIIPVPLHWRRKQKRHANQAEEIGKIFSQMSGFPWANALRRIRDTESQTKLTRRQRLKNLRGAFTLKKEFRDTFENQTILLIDDVFTTGSTVNECALVLRRDGRAKQVAVLTVIRG